MTHPTERGVTAGDLGQVPSGPAHGFPDWLIEQAVGDDPEGFAAYVAASEEARRQHAAFVERSKAVARWAAARSTALGHAEGWLPADLTFEFGEATSPDGRAVRE